MGVSLCGHVYHVVLPTKAVQGRQQGAGQLQHSRRPPGCAIMGAPVSSAMEPSWKELRTVPGARPSSQYGHMPSTCRGHAIRCSCKGMRTLLGTRQQSHAAARGVCADVRLWSRILRLGTTEGRSSARIDSRCAEHASCMVPEKGFLACWCPRLPLRGMV